MPKLSVIIIAKNAAAHIEQCLQSVQWADEIIVLDSGSTDETVSLCQRYTPLVFQTDWPGYGPQKNRALDKATGDWVLSLDADEWIGPELTAQIQRVMQHPTHSAYAMPRRNAYCGQWIRHGDVGKDRVTRLFQRNTARFSDDIVHERLIAQQPVGRCHHPIYHHAYPNLEELLSRLNHYTTLSAQARHQQGKRSSLTKAITHSAWAFFRAYILRRGFLDGKMGFIAAASSAQSSFYRYAKLLLLNEKANAPCKRPS